MTRFLILGDIMGRPGRKCLSALLPKLREKYAPHAVLANGENSAGGFGLSAKVYQEFIKDLGIDCVTMGNHWHDKREIYDFLPTAERLVLPSNMGNVSDPFLGLKILEASDKTPFAVMNFIGRVHMVDGNRDIFQAAEQLLERIPKYVPIRLVDMHAEATSEKQGLGHFLSGRVSMVYGTHSHVPTADERILGNHTGFITDVGMTGGYDSVIGIDKEAALRRFRTGEKKNFEPAKDDPWLCAVVADIDANSGRCTAIERLRWRLEEVL